MAEKTQSKNSRKTASRKADSSEERKIVLVGTYKGDQLTDWRGWYNYPISDDDKINEVDAAKIKELWLFKDTKDERRYKAEFVGVKTRKELIDVSAWGELQIGLKRYGMDLLSHHNFNGSLLWLEGKVVRQ